VDLDTPPASRKLKVKAKHTAKAQGNQNGAANGSNAPTAPVIHTETEPEIDESLLSARELKKKRKEEEKRKRDERKARKERELEEVAPVGGGNPVDNKEDKKAGFGNGEGEGRKRKAEDGGEGKKKKRQCLVGLDL
jgi:DNA-directed RNA polymerase I subunit RPA43